MKAEDRKRNERTERLMERNMIYPDLGSSLRTINGGTRGEVAVIVGKGERISVVTTVED